MLSTRTEKNSTRRKNEGPGRPPIKRLEYNRAAHALAGEIMENPGNEKYKGLGSPHEIVRHIAWEIFGYESLKNIKNLADWKRICVRLDMIKKGKKIEYKTFHEKDLDKLFPGPDPGSSNEKIIRHSMKDGVTVRLATAGSLSMLRDLFEKKKIYSADERKIFIKLVTGKAVDVNGIRSAAHAGAVMKRLLLYIPGEEE